MRRAILAAASSASSAAVISAAILLCAAAHAQMSVPAAPLPLPPTIGTPLPSGPPPPGYAITPMTLPSIPPQIVELVKLEDQFAQAVAKGGGPAFASWFAEDGTTLSNGQPPVIGRAAIERTATWKPADYQLTWYVEGAGMGPSGDAAYTWGHYDSTAHPPGAAPVTHSGRYLTFWKKVQGHWKVALEASAEEPPEPPTAAQSPQGGAQNVIPGPK